MNNDNQSSEVKTKNITLGSVFSWIFGVLFFLGGIGMLFSHFISGLLTLVAALLILPPSSNVIKRKFNFSMSRGVKILAVLVLLVIAGMAMGDTKPATVVDNTNPNSQVSAPVNNTPAQPLTLEQQITQKVNEVLGATNSTKKPTIVDVKVDTYNAIELKAYQYEPTEDVKGILITINSSENLTTNLQKSTMYNEAVKIFQAIFPLSPQIGDVVIWSQLPVKDKYGNTKDDTAITFAMGRPLYQKINWTNYNHRDLPALLNSEDKTDDRNGSHELIKF